MLPHRHRRSVPDLAEVGDRWPRFAAAVDAQRGVPFGARPAAAAARGGDRRAEPVPRPARPAVRRPTCPWDRRWPTWRRSGSCTNAPIRRGEVVNEQLQTALNSRVIIEQAKGVLAQQGKIAMDVAFDRLRGYSRRTNQLLSRVARRIVERELDPDAVLEP